MNRFTRFRRPDGKRRRPASVRLVVEALESRNLLSGATLGPLVQITGLDPFAGNTADNPASQPGTYFPGSEVEPYFAVNPTNPKNLVGVWTIDEWSNGGGRGIGIAVSMNGGNSWKTGVMRGLTLTAGGSFERAGDSWLSFAPNGTLYFTTILVDILPDGSGYAPSETVVENSTDGGLDWSAPITIVQSNDPSVFNDKDSITADPTASGYAYSVWEQLMNKYKGPAMFTRTTDGGQTWSTPSVIYDPGGNDFTIFNQIVVSPNGTLNDFMNSVPTNTGGPHVSTLLVSQSSDKGLTWSKKPITIASDESIAVTDPNNGQVVDEADTGWNGGATVDFNVTEDRSNGYLYTVWTDARFSNSQHDSIAFSMSKDGGLTWSAPIQINQTPTNIPNGDQQAFQPTVAVAANGTVAVSYYDFRFNGTGPGLLTDYWLVQGKAGTDLTIPANWGNEVRLTNTSFNMEVASVPRGYFIGDYQGLAAAGNDFDAFFAATNGTDPGDIFFRDPPAGPSTAGALGAAAGAPDLAGAAILIGAPDRVPPALVAAGWATVGDGGAPAGSTGTAAVLLPSAGLADPAGGVGLLPGDFLAAASVAPLAPTGGLAPAPVATTPATTAALPLAPQAVDRFFAAAGKRDGTWVVAPAMRGAEHGIGDGWDDVLGQALSWQEAAAAFPGQAW